MKKLNNSAKELLVIIKEIKSVIKKNPVDSEYIAVIIQFRREENRFIADVHANSALKR